MADDDALDGVDEPDDPEMVDIDTLDDDLDDELDDELADDVLVAEDDADLDDDVVADTDAAPAPEAPADDEDDEEEEEDDDDVEAGLDVILKDRLVAIEDEDDEEATNGEERPETTAKVLPKRPGEFVCQSCFLVKHPGQLADAERMLCRDCV